MCSHFGLSNRQEMIFSSLFSVSQVFCSSKSIFSLGQWTRSTEICKALQDIAKCKYKASLPSSVSHQSPPAFALWPLSNTCVAEVALSCIFQMQDPNAFFSQIKYFHLVQTSETRVWSLRYPQIWLADSWLSVGNLKKSKVASQVRG